MNLHSNQKISNAGGAFDPGIDLLKALNLHANVSSFEGVSITQGQQKKVAFKLQGTSRQLVLPFKTYEHAVELLRKNSDFTFAATLKQDERNPGTIISFSNGYNRYGGCYLNPNSSVTPSLWLFLRVPLLINALPFLSSYSSPSPSPPH